jgi:ribosomal protein L37AE/L43A
VELTGPFLLLLLAGVIAFRVIAAVGRRQRLKDEERRAAAQEKTCPRCAEQIKAAALVCRHCGHEFAEPIATTPSVHPPL